MSAESNVGLTKQTHYNSNDIETKDIIECLSIQLGQDVTAYQGFCIGNIIKYLSRFTKKGSPVEDLTKARVYLDYLIENVQKDTRWE